MRRPGPLRASLAAGLVLAQVVATAPAAAQRVEVGNAAAVVGDVKMSNAAIRTPRAIQRREHLAWGDRVDTGKKSQLQILLLDRSTFGIGASSRVQIDRFVYDPDAGRSVFATFAKGALRFFSGREAGENSANVQTPAGRIGIRGTAVDMLVGEEAEEIGEDEDFVDRIDDVDSDEDEATLVVLRGPGAATAGGLTVGRAEVEGAGVTVVLDQPGLAAYIPRNGAAPIGPFQISNKGLAKVQDELAPEVARAADNNDAETAAAVAGAAVLACVLLVCRDDDNDDDDNVRQPRSMQPTSTQPTGRGNTSSPNDPRPPR
jgi:hypothetical protein